jgi:hypothetical protein
MDFPCIKINNWDSADSFVSHKNSLKNLRRIREDGLRSFISQQNERIELLDEFIAKYDDGKSKKFFCLALTLLPIKDIRTALKEIDLHENKVKDKKSLAKLLRDILQQKANVDGIELVYRNKPV